MHDTDSFLTTLSDRQTHINSSQIKFISPTKWQKYLIETLKSMTQQYHHKRNLITDFMTIVASIPQHNFVQATLQIRPFKPEFFEILPVFSIANHSTMAETVIKKVKYHTQTKQIQKQKSKKHKMTQQTLTKQFDKDYHPFKFIIKNVKRLFELKYKGLIDSKKITDFKHLFNELKSDMTIFNEFIHKACQPYKKLFKNTSVTKIPDSGLEGSQFEEFIDTFLADNEKLNKCVHKIIVYASRTFYQEKINKKMKDYPQIEQFGMPEEFRIDGCYIRAMNSLMQLSESFKEQVIMKKLLQYRLNILIDISEYYKQKQDQTKELQVNADIQIQIIQYTLAKLKGWACEIYAQLKYLEYMQGDQMHYKYEESSYIYSQLCMAFEVLELDENVQK